MRPVEDDPGLTAYRLQPSLPLHLLHPLADAVHGNRQSLRLQLLGGGDGGGGIEDLMWPGQRDLQRRIRSRHTTQIKHAPPPTIGEWSPAPLRGDIVQAGTLY